MQFPCSMWSSALQSKKNHWVLIMQCCRAWSLFGDDSIVELLKKSMLEKQEKRSESLPCFESTSVQSLLAAITAKVFAMTRLLFCLLLSLALNHHEKQIMLLVILSSPYY
mmetsp:Transcript_9358/g.13863  ORF Transcript_9358/g.13863 Transcript_9358/m.13863 type:complete len:110 (+) Transcript_9358:608-937(+)